MDPVLKRPHLNAPRADLTAIRNSVTLEEKIVRDHQEQRTAQVKRSTPYASEFKDYTLHDSEKTFSTLGRFLLVLGWLAAGVLVLLYVQETLLSRETSQRLASLQSEKERLGRSYAALRNASEAQSAEMEWLNSQLHDMSLELNKAKADKVVYARSLEKKYREELMRITVRYESKLAASRGMAQTWNAVVNSLKAQSQAFEKIFDQAGISDLSGAAEGLSQKPLSTGGTSVLQGKVISVSGRQGFVVVDRGAAQGVRSGLGITISRSGSGPAGGHIDRVYPTMSVAVLRDAGMSQGIQEGDSVSFS